MKTIAITLPENLAVILSELFEDNAELKSQKFLEWAERGMRSEKVQDD